ncbi:MAG: substrate-binding domain-containing protein, partial [Succinivibrio sp.]
MKLVKAILAASLTAAIAMSAAQAKQITIGFSQIGAESEWRTANTNDVKAAAKANDVNLIFSDAQQKQENQIKAIRTFIAKKVDLIGFVPIVATGWDNILREAKRAKIPVLIMDRDLTVSDP